jgi:sugar O-acyltransferase (sialic acid O-acetyltransferase NeuD family)
MRIVLIGGGGHASDILGAFEALFGLVGGGRNPVIGFLDDADVDEARFGHRGLRQLGTVSALRSIDASHYLLATGYPKSRMALLDRIGSVNLEPASVIHPMASVPIGFEIGAGSTVLAAACISPLARIGQHACVSNGAIIGHDCVVEDFVSVMPGAVVSGDTVLGRGSMIGTNATIIQGVRIGAGATIGAGAVVVKDIPAGVTAVGIPAKWRE